MRKKLAIVGHSTRGKEVIELLEMMGGKTNCDSTGDNLGLCYLIDDENDIVRQSVAYIDYEDGELNIFTLEEFLEKYPYKVGDKVHIYVQNDDTDGRYDIEVAEISSMRWNPARCKIAYKMKDINREFYKEEIKCKVDDNTKPSKMKNVLAELLEHIKTTPKEDLEREFEKIEEWSNVGPTIEEFRTFCACVNKKPVYPKTYAACRAILDNYNIGNISGYKASLLASLQDLLVCRNAYWKIAGEQMGLGKPWEPDWSTSEPKYVLAYTCNGTEKQWETTYCKMFAFPTEEMRDAFYENFKDIIESCKELL